MPYDTVITNGRWFDGTGAPSALRNIGVHDGRVTTVAAGPLDTTGADVIDATGQWVIPGIIDIHTHYHIETLCEPEPSESLRHGVTTVMLGSCPLSTVYLDSVDAGDIFGRVEAIPRHYVIEQLDGARSWSNPREYVTVLEQRNLGPNLAAFIGHSDMRAATMGLDRATRKDVRPSRQSSHGWRRCWRRPPTKGSQTRAHTCAIWRSTTLDCACCGTSTTPRSRAPRSCRSSVQSTAANSDPGTESMQARCAKATAPTSSS